MALFKNCVDGFLFGVCFLGLIGLCAISDDLDKSVAEWLRVTASDK